MTAAGSLARGLALAGAAVAAVSVVAFLPPARLGIFGRDEAAILTLLAAGAVSAAGLALSGRAARARGARSALAVPLVALALWSLAAAPVSEFPWRSLVGLPQAGDGVLLLLALAAIAGALGAHADGTTRAVLAWQCAAATAVASLWQAFMPAAWIPWSVPALLAWLGLAAWAALAVAPGNRRVNLVAGTAVLALALAVSENKSALVLVLALGVPVFAGARLIDAARLRRAGMVLASAMIPAATAAVWWLGAHGHGASLVSRARIYDVLAAAFADRPAGIVVGFGWGGVVEAFFRHLPAGADRLYGDSWDMLARDFSNAHNVALDFWFAAGLPGLAFVLGLPALIVWRARGRDLAVAIAFAAVWAGLSVLWYHASYSWAASVVAFALVARRPWALGRAFPARAVAGGTALALAASVLWLVDFGYAARRALDADPPSACLADFPADPGRGDFGLRQALGENVRAVADGEAGASPARLAALVCAVDRRFAAAPSLHLAIAGAFYRAEAAIRPALGMDAAELRSWPAYVGALLKFAPKRTDLAVPYLAHLVSTGDWATLAVQAESLMARNPDDPVGLWFSGMVLIRAAEPEPRQAGLARLQRALESGFGRIVPLPEETIRQVTGGG